MFVSIWMPIGLVLLVASVSRIASSNYFNAKVSPIDAAPLVTVLIMCACCFVAGVCDALALPVPGNLALAVIFTGAFVIVLCASKGRRHQGQGSSGIVENQGGYHWADSSIKDAVPYAVLLAVVLVCAFVQFGFDLSINFASTDPGTHFNLTMVTFETGRFPAGLWFTYYITARAIELVVPVLADGSEYKVFIAMEILYLYLNGAVFFSVAKKLSASNKGLAIPLGITIIYLLGYPLNALAFGFSYLGMGVTLCLTLVAMNCIETPHPMIRCVLIALPLLSLVVCYSLFVPVALLGVFVTCMLRIRELISRHPFMFVISLAVLAVMTVLVIGYVIGTGSVAVLNSPGYIYSNFYGDFLLPLPIALFGLIAICKSHRQLDSSVGGVALAAIISVFIALMLYRISVLSAYYYYKFYYLLWSCVFLCAVRGISEIPCSCWTLARCYAVIWICVIAVSFSGVDERLASSRPDLHPVTVSNVVAGVYSCNAREMRSQGISDSEVALWEAAGNLRASDDEYVPLVGTNIDVYWYQAVTRQYYAEDMRHFYYWQYEGADWASLFIRRLESCRYCAVLRSQEIPYELADYLSHKEVVFSNDAGAIYQLK